MEQNRLTAERLTQIQKRANSVNDITLSCWSAGVPTSLYQIRNYCEVTFARATAAPCRCQQADNF